MSLSTPTAEDLVEVFDRSLKALAEKRGGLSRLPMIAVSVVSAGGLAEERVIDPVPHYERTLVDVRAWLLDIFPTLVETKFIGVGDDFTLGLAYAHDPTLMILQIPLSFDGSVTASSGPLFDLIQERNGDTNRSAW